MGLFLMILGIFLALNILPIIFGFVAMDEGEDFLTGFLTVWAGEILIALAVGIMCLIIWLIATGWTMMQEPIEAY